MTHENIETKGRSIDINKQEIFPLTSEPGTELDSLLEGLTIRYLRLEPRIKIGNTELGIQVVIEGTAKDSELARQLESDLVKYQQYNKGFTDFSAAKLWLRQQTEELKNP